MLKSTVPLVVMLLLWFDKTLADSQTETSKQAGRPFKSRGLRDVSQET